MDAAATSALPDWQGLSVYQLIPWAKTFIQYTDDVMEALSEDDAALDYREADPAGGYVFSVREQAMHIADTRHSALGWITGAKEDEDFFCTEYGGLEKPWQWRTATRAEILAHHAAGRARLDEWFGKPGSALFDSTAHMQAEWAKNNAKLQADGQDIGERLARGPGRLINVLFFIVAHETSHRTVLQHLLRMSGAKTVRYA